MQKRKYHSYCNLYSEVSMDNTFNYARLGSNIRTRRHANHLTQAELAQRAGCSFSTISKLERGACSLSAALLFNLAAALKCHASELVEGL